MKLDDALQIIDVDTKVKITLYGGDGVNESFYRRTLYTGVVYSCKLEKYRDNKVIDASVNLMHQLVISISDKEGGESDE